MSELIHIEYVLECDFCDARVRYSDVPSVAAARALERAGGWVIGKTVRCPKCSPRNKQYEELARRGIRFDVNGRGKVIVLRSEVKNWGLSKSKRDDPDDEPDWAVLDEFTKRRK